jgi:hypothetical protein
MLVLLDGFGHHAPCHAIVHLLLLVGNAIFFLVVFILLHLLLLLLVFVQHHQVLLLLLLFLECLCLLQEGHVVGVLWEVSCRDVQAVIVLG